MLMDAAERLRPPAALQQHYCAGMPQLGLYGLSENWLLKECGHLHWLAIARAQGMQRPAFADAAGHRSYAALTAVHLREAQLDALGENAPFSLSVRATSPGRARHFSAQTLRSGTLRAARVELLSAFVRRDGGSNRSIVRAPVEGTGNGDPALADAALSLQARARLFRSGEGVARMGLQPVAHGEALCAAAFTPCPHNDFNGAGLLYFASFQALADRAELACFGLRPAITSERELYFYGNIDPGETVRVELLAAREDAADLAHWWRVRRSADGVRIADVLTRKRRLA
jgi:probable biosynthetic protein (TIGR04099 family)